jgi:hypothetical protein
MSELREAVCHPEFLDDLRHWVDTDQRTAMRLLELMRAVLRDLQACGDRKVSLPPWQRRAARGGAPRTGRPRSPDPG